MRDLTLDKVAEVVDLVKARHANVERWAAVAKFGGHGDTMVLIAYARALRRWLDATFPGESWGILALAKVTGSDVDSQVWAGTKDWLTAFVCVPNPRWSKAVERLRPGFDLFFDVQYVVGTYANRVMMRNAPWVVAEAGQNVHPYEHIYAGFPASNHDIGKKYRVSQWAIMSASGLFEVTPADLHVATEPAGAFFEEGELLGCVAIHVGQGGAGTLKTPHRLVMEAAAAAARTMGRQAVQLGTREEAMIPGAVDARGLTLADTARVIRDADFVVDGEGFLQYVARAVGTQAVIFFGPTPRFLFGLEEERDEEGKLVFPGHVNWSRGACDPCWWWCPAWGNRCRERARCDSRLRPDGQCLNLPSPVEAAEVVAGAIMNLDAKRTTKKAGEKGAGLPTTKDVATAFRQVQQDLNAHSPFPKVDPEKGENWGHSSDGASGALVNRTQKREREPWHSVGSAFPKAKEQKP